MFTLYKKTMELNEKNIPQSIKNTHDPDKWRKKFLMVFNRERIIDFSGNGFTG
jgi:hypothetical protein